MTINLRMSQETHRTRLKRKKQQLEINDLLANYPKGQGEVTCQNHQKKSGDPYGTRTRVAGVRGRSPRPLDEGAE